MASQRMITCACCGQPGRLGGRGLIVNCESRIRRYHRDDLADFPRQQRARADMLADYTTWRGRRPQATQQEIADQMGVTRSALRRALDRATAETRNKESTATTLRAAEQKEETTMSWFSEVVRAFTQPISDWSQHQAYVRAVASEEAEQVAQDEYDRRNRWGVREEAAALQQVGGTDWWALNAEVGDAVMDQHTKSWNENVAQGDAEWEQRVNVEQSGQGAVGPELDAHLPKAEQADLELSEDIAAGSDYVAPIPGADREDDYAEQARDGAERGPDVTDYWTSEEEDNWNNFRDVPDWVNYPETYAGHPYNQAKDDWAGRTPTAEHIAEAEEDAYYERANRENKDAAARYAERDAHLSEEEERDLTLSEDIAAGVVPVEYTDDGVRIGKEFHSHDSIPTADDEDAYLKEQLAARDAGEYDVSDAMSDVERQGELAQDAQRPDRALDQWRAPGTAGHDEEWAYWEHEDRSNDWSDVMER